MTYDGTDPNDDGTVEADVDNQSTTTVELDSQRTSYAPKVVTNADSPFTTDGRSVYYVDSSAGPVTVELATADAENGNVLELYDVGESAGTNAITVQTEGSESINPGGNSSIQVTRSGAFVKLRNYLGNWFTDRRRQSESVTTEDVVVNSSLTIGFAPLELGSGANAGSGSTAIGTNSDANTANATAIGDGSVSGLNGVAIGESSDSSGANGAIALGSGATTAGFSGVSIAIGRNASAPADGVAIAASASTQYLSRIGGRQLAFGGVRDTVADADLNNSELTVELDEANSAFRLRGKDSGGVVREATIAW